MKDRQHPQRWEKMWKSQITSFFICNQDVPKMLVSDVLCVPRSHIISTPALCLLGWGIKKTQNNTTEKCQSLIFFHQRGCKRWDYCIPNHIKTFQMKVLLVELWCSSSHWKRHLGKLTLRDISMFFPFGHVREGKWWPEFSQSSIRKRWKETRVFIDTANNRGWKTSLWEKKGSTTIFSC